MYSDINTCPKYIVSIKFRDTFVMFVQDYMNENNCKKSKVPAFLGISYDIFIKIYELGKIPRPNILTRIADKAGYSIEYLLGRTKEDYFEKSNKAASFLERFDLLKNKYKLSDYAVAMKLHIATNYITNWRNKNYTPCIDYLIILSEIFKTSIDYLLGRTDDEAPYTIDTDWC
ncbi:MAG TPA: helix-turn-helix domain-containing protein [Candidatus Borkfalkia excrementigallinarum]|uniref:Helix-turn-helix domain-containing protein n=1 Tax=Candidatus Borkfalkia excrementigallinarum TaxID=2838506 RepID=A0A9D1ZX29_9FIRM|nr:helix-turn-helix domain-containing protein [Candidatus Borkfalkia excrementigallinarum]